MKGLLVSAFAGTWRNENKRALALVVALLLSGFASTLHAQGWVQVWSDEFNGASGVAPSSSTWNFDTGGGGWGNGELETYCAPYSSTYPCDPNNTNIYEDGSGHLVIRALNYNGTWTSGRMNTSGKEQWTYGRMEASMLLPEGAGMWPAFWMLGANIGSVGWPNCGEQDIMEWVQSYGNYGTSSHIHGPGYSGANGIGATYYFGNGPTSNWHTYGDIWGYNQIQFYRDSTSNIFLTITPSNIPSGDTWVFNNPFFILLNLAVGGGGFPGTTNSGTPNPSYMLVDYVRVYQWSNGGGINTSAWYNVINQNSNSCVDASGWGTANGTSVQQWSCGNAQYNQEWQFRATDSGYYNVLNRNAAGQNEVWDDTGVSSSSGAKIQLWQYGGGANQQWQPVSLGGGYYKFVNRYSGLCLDVPAASTANGVQLQQYTCNGTGAQSWKLSQQP